MGREGCDEAVARVKVDNTIVLHCSMKIAEILLRSEIEGEPQDGFWLNFVEGGIPVFWPLIPGAENMVGKVVDK